MKKQHQLTWLIITLSFITLYFILLSCFRAERPAYHYPDWTPQQLVIIKKVSDRHTTVTRTAINKAYFKRGGKVWWLNL